MNEQPKTLMDRYEAMKGQVAAYSRKRLNREVPQLPNFLESTVEGWLEDSNTVVRKYVGRLAEGIHAVISNKKEKASLVTLLEAWRDLLVSEEAGKVVKAFEAVVEECGETMATKLGFARETDEEMEEAMEHLEEELDKMADSILGIDDPDIQREALITSLRSLGLRKLAHIDADIAEDSSKLEEAYQSGLQDGIDQTIKKLTEKRSKVPPPPVFGQVFR